MNVMRYLFDENIPTKFLRGLMTFEPAIEIRQVGMEVDSPPKRTLDPDVLKYAERKEYAIVTFDMKTFPKHAKTHCARGVSHHGVFVVPAGDSIPVSLLCDELIMIWAASDVSEWFNKTDFIPLKTTR